MNTLNMCWGYLVFLHALLAVCLQIRNPGVWVGMPPPPLSLSVFEDRNTKSSCMKIILRKAMASLESKQWEENYELSSLWTEGGRDKMLCRQINKEEEREIWVNTDSLIGQIL